MAKLVETRWWWIRHAPVINPEGRIYGQRDMPCDTSASDSMAAIARRLPRSAIWFTSHLTRTRDTAEAIRSAGAIAGDGPKVEPEFAEQHLGEWQGKTYAEVGAFGQGQGGISGHKLWLTAAGVRPPGGESFIDVIARVSAAIERWTSEIGGRDIVVVAHGGTIRAALAHALRMDPEAALAFSIDTLSLTRIDRLDGPGEGNAWRVGRVNLPPTG